jgi:hemerythrin-like domain-containing protein
MKVFSVLQRLISAPGGGEPEIHGHLQKIIQFLKVYVDQCHHAKEEEVFFPAIPEAGLGEMEGLVKEFVSEHLEGRKLVQDMEKALVQHEGAGGPGKIFCEKAARYLELFRKHIRKENGILFPAAREKLPLQLQERIAREFKKVERERVGEGGYGAVDRLAEELEQAVG